MTGSELTANDIALRKRITEPCVHIPCGRIRGPITSIGRWQSCLCEDHPQKWTDCDVSREKDLCIICFRGTAGGTSRWSWRACDTCRAVNDTVGSAVGARPFALGRHSVMNGIGVRGGQSATVTDEQIARLLAFARGDGRLTQWGREEYGRLASAFEPDADVRLRLWQDRWPPSGAASLDAFVRLLGDTFPTGLL